MKNQQKKSMYKSVLQIMKTKGKISLKELRNMGFKNPYSPIYHMRKDGWVVQTRTSLFFGTYYVKIMTARQRMFDEVFMRIFLRVMIVSIIALIALFIF